jgi:hypothetical protein
MIVVCALEMDPLALLLEELALFGTIMLFS